MYDNTMPNDTLQQLSDAVDRLVVTNLDDVARVLRAVAILDAKYFSALREYDRRQLYRQSNYSSTQEFLELRLGLSPEDAAAQVRTARASP